MSNTILKTNVIPSKILSKILRTLLFVLLPFLSPLWGSPPPKTIAISQFIEHKALDAVRQGLLEVLAQRGYREGENLTVIFQNAQGNGATATQIAQQFIGLEPDLMVAIATPSAQPLVRLGKTYPIPLVFSAVTDPVAAGLVSSLIHPGGHITGVSDAPPIQEQLEFLKKVLPQAQRIGVIYNPGDDGANGSLPLIRKEAQGLGLTLVEVTPTRSADIQGSLLSLVGKVDALYIPLDNMVVASMESLSALALQHQLPLFSSDSGSVEAGALACLGYSYHQTGQKTGEMLADILEGADPSSMDVASPGEASLFVNRKALEALGLTLPPEFLGRVHE